MQTLQTLRITRKLKLTIRRVKGLFTKNTEVLGTREPIPIR